MHHADAAGDGVAGVVQDDLLAVDRDGALVRLLHAVEDLHQGGLAGAVLAAQGVDGARAYGDVDVAVGDDAGETLGDAAQFDGSGRAGRVDGALSSGKEAAGRGQASATLARQLRATRVELTHCYGPAGGWGGPRAEPGSERTRQVTGWT
ncbi:hypothetical protein Srubr_55890 [Streptomyces rubradiris]|uniref:Uncharacterized protein n=1 Tax=Streptomyces rubradiris TaxID=285531 RepID=A0ABQ3RIS6_STRRR|nr:hypothetical protein Srubr_55890 [Streptomyces rubradiris]